MKQSTKHTFSHVPCILQRFFFNWFAKAHPKRWVWFRRFQYRIFRHFELTFRDCGTLKQSKIYLKPALNLDFSVQTTSKPRKPTSGAKKHPTLLQKFDIGNVWFDSVSSWWGILLEVFAHPNATTMKTIVGCECWGHSQCVLLFVKRNIFPQHKNRRDFCRIWPIWNQ